eukprot:4945204-Amphidinium_carterae.1
MEKEIRSADSPLFEWERSLVREAIRNKQTARGLADDITAFPVTLRDFNSWVLNCVLKRILPFAMEGSFVFLGKSGCGKTPLAGALAMALSSFHIERLGLDTKPSFRTSNNMDFFRGEPGEVHVPFIWDDGEVVREDAEAVKGFLDLTGIDPKVKA